MALFKGKNGQAFRHVVLGPFGQSRRTVSIAAKEFLQEPVGLGSVRGLEDSSDISGDGHLHRLARHVLGGVAL